MPVTAALIGVERIGQWRDFTEADRRMGRSLDLILSGDKASANVRSKLQEMEVGLLPVSRTRR